MVTVGLSSVGPPPVTSSSQLPSNCRTHDVPPYSRYRLAPSTRVYQSFDRSTSLTTTSLVSSMSSVGNPSTGDPNLGYRRDSGPDPGRGAGCSWTEHHCRVL